MIYVEAHSHYYLPFLIDYIDWTAYYVYLWVFLHIVYIWYKVIFVGKCVIINKGYELSLGKLHAKVLALNACRVCLIKSVDVDLRVSPIVVQDF